jgi:hypothetical protein
MSRELGGPDQPERTAGVPIGYVQLAMNDGESSHGS